MRRFLIYHKLWSNFFQSLIPNITKCRVICKLTLPFLIELGPGDPLEGLVRAFVAQTTLKSRGWAC
jgi:hypothetical protein